MPVKIGQKKFKNFSKAATSIAKKKGISKERAKAYVAQTERYQGREPATGRPIVPLPRSKKKITRKR